MAVRAAILTHMKTIGNFLIPFHISYSSVEAYIEATHMDRDCAWGTEIEILIYYTLPYCYITPTCQVV